MPNLKNLLSVALVASLAVNLYLFTVAMNWQKAWLAQIMTTSDIERILKKSGADISFESIQTIVKKEYGSSFRVLPKEEAANEIMGPYENIIMADETKLYFKDSIFVGSKANVPNGIEYWWFNK